MWYKAEYSSETIDNLKKEMQRLQEEARRLLCEAKLMEREEEAEKIGDFSYMFQAVQPGKENRDQQISWLCRNVHF